MTQKTYFVYGNLNHDTKDYKRGDTLEAVKPADLAALIEAGVVGTEKPTEIEEKIPQEEDTYRAPELMVGGQENKSGEPNLDNGSTGEASPQTKRSFLSKFLGKKSAEKEALKNHIITQEDLDLNPQFVEMGYKVGDPVDFDFEAADAGEKEADANVKKGEVKPADNAGTLPPEKDPSLNL